jgi:hypothetical protein
LTRHQRSAFEPLARGQSPPWRVKGNGSDEVTLQVYPHARYIDEVVGLRVKDQGRLYAHQDANWNVTALTDLTGRVIEQYWYSPYGQLEAHVASHPFDFDDDGDVDAQDIAAGTSAAVPAGATTTERPATANASTPTGIGTSMWMTTRSSTTTWPPGTAKPPCNASPRPATAGAETCLRFKGWSSNPKSSDTS